MLLNDPEWSKWSSREISRRVHVAHGFVDKLRALLATVASSSQPRTFIHHETGKPTTMRTEHIGKSAKAAADDTSWGEFTAAPVIVSLSA